MTDTPHLSAVPDQGEPVSAPVTPTASTPEPVRKAALLYGSIVTVLVTLLGAAVTLGVLSSEQAAAINSLIDYVGTAIVPLGVMLTAVSSLVAGVAGAWTTAEVGRRKVTPVPEVHGEFVEPTL